MSDFEDELSEIVRRQGKQEKPSQMQQSITDKVLGVLNKENTFGYIVYINTAEPEEQQGLLVIGGSAAVELAYSHRVADKLIDEIIYAEDEEDGENATN